MKTLFEFVRTKTTQEDNIVETTLENGEIKKEVVTSPKTEIFHFAIQKPGRSLYEQADLFYSVKLSSLIKAGVILSNQLRKRIIDDDGFLSETEKKQLVEAYDNVSKFREQRDKVLVVPDASRTEEEKKLLMEAMQGLADSITKITNFEQDRMSIFSESAETKARIKTIFWFLLQLSYRKDGDKYVPIFEGKEFEDKLASYDKIDEQNDEFLIGVIKVMNYLISNWYAGQASTETEFQALLGQYDKEQADQKEK